MIQRDFFPIRNQHFIIFGLCVILFLDIIALIGNEVFASPAFGPTVSTAWPKSHIIRSFNNGTASGSGYTDIIEVSYFSDGKTVEATYWLDGEFDPNPDTEVSYMILIDADFLPTGINGIDFGERLFYKDGKWQEQTIEWSAHSTKSLDRVISSTGTRSTLYEEGKNYVSMSFDLESIGSPSKYRMLFATSEKFVSDEQPIELFDYSEWIVIPKPEFEFTTIPETIKIIEGEQVRVEFNVAVEPPAQYLLNFPIDFNDKDIRLEFDGPAMSVSSVGSIGLTIDASEVPKGHYTLTIPIQTKINNEPIKDIATRDLYEDSIIPSNVGTRVANPFKNVEYIFTVEVVPPKNMGEILTESVNPWEGTVNIFTALSAALGGFILWLWKGRRHETSDKPTKSSAV